MEEVDYSKFKNELQIARGINSFSQEKQANKSQEIGSYNYLNRRNQVLPKTANSVDLNREQKVFARQQNENLENERQRVFNLQEARSKEYEESSQRSSNQKISKEKQEVLTKCEKIVKLHKRAKWELIFWFIIPYDLLNLIIHIIGAITGVGLLLGSIMSFCGAFCLNIFLWGIGEEKISSDEIAILSKDEKISLGEKIGGKISKNVDKVKEKVANIVWEKIKKIGISLIDLVPILGAIPFLTLSALLTWWSSKKEHDKASEGIAEFEKRRGV